MEAQLAKFAELEAARKARRGYGFELNFREAWIFPFCILALLCVVWACVAHCGAKQMAQMASATPQIPLRERFPWQQQQRRRQMRQRNAE